MLGVQDFQHIELDIVYIVGISGFWRHYELL
jgi:hypothetical protein